MPDPTDSPWSTCLIYGAYGYSGKLITKECLARGFKPVLAGRNAEKLAAFAAECGLAHEVVDLSDATALDALLSPMTVVIHCAGPFSRTSKPMVDACLRTGTHYLDITGEVAVFEACAATDAAAKAAGIMVMPGTGFDVVPTDCLAAHLKARMPTATHLELAFQSVGGSMSHGTAMTTVENLNKPSVVRREGRLKSVRSGKLAREVDFGQGPVFTMGIPWGDISTAWHTTGIPNITVYTVVPKKLRAAAWASSFIRPVFGLAWVQKFLRSRVERRPAGPSEADRSRGYNLLWGRVEGPDGAVESRLRTTQGYTLTALASVEIARKVLGGEVKPGYQTPASAYGPDLILEFEGSERQDL